MFLDDTFETPHRAYSISHKPVTAYIKYTKKNTPNTENHSSAITDCSNDAVTMRSSAPHAYQNNVRHWSRRYEGDHLPLVPPNHPFVCKQYLVNPSVGLRTACCAAISCVVALCFCSTREIVRSID